MERKIKFRVWNKENGKFWEDGNSGKKGYEWNEDWLCLTLDGEFAVFDTEPYGGMANNPEKFILMQYTGLKDKNGKEIYSGDIVEATEQKIHKHWSAFQERREEKRKKRFIVEFSLPKGTQFKSDYRLGGEYYAVSYITYYDDNPRYPLKGTGEWSCNDAYNRDYVEYTDFKVIGNIYENPNLIEDNK